MTKQEVIESLQRHLDIETSSTHEVGLRARYKEAHANTLTQIIESIKDIPFKGWRFSSVRKISSDKNSDILIFKRNETIRR
jgi:hypothetical protein